MDLSEIHRLLEIAAEAGIPGADTLIGWVLLAEKDCGDCRSRAQRWFERALMARADRDARLGLAAALTLPGAELSIARAHYSALLAEDAEDVVHLRALTLRGSIEPSKVAATAFTEKAAREGFAEAQFRLWKRYLSGVDPHARLWLAMAALQGHVPAIEQIEASVLPAMILAAESRLLAMADDPDTALGRAAEWCGGQGGRDAGWLTRCRLTALEAHVACVLPGSVTDTLGLKTFERSEIYARCRIVEMTDFRQPRMQ